MTLDDILLVVSVLKKAEQKYKLQHIFLYSLLMELALYNPYILEGKNWEQYLDENEVKLIKSQLDFEQTEILNQQAWEFEKDP